MFGEKRVDVGPRFSRITSGTRGRKDDFEAFFRDVPAHDVFRAGIESRAGGDDFGAGKVDFRTGDEDGGRAVAEEAGRDEIGDGNVVALQGEGTGFDADEGGHLIGISAD